MFLSEVSVLVAWRSIQAHPERGKRKKERKKERKESPLSRAGHVGRKTIKLWTFGHCEARGGYRSISSNKSSSARSRLILEFLEDRLQRWVEDSSTGGTDSKMFWLDRPNNVVPIRALVFEAGNDRAVKCCDMKWKSEIAMNWLARIDRRIDWFVSL